MQSVPGPEPWGGPGGQLVLALGAPITVALSPGSCLALDLTVDGNDHNGAAASYLDFDLDNSGAMMPGFALSNGTGCPAAPAAPSSVLQTQGLYAPGTSFSVFGSDYAPNMPVVTFVTARLLAQRIALAGTSPTCWFYLDLASGNPLLIEVASATGSISPGNPDGLLPVPRNPVFCGGVLYLQNVSPITPNAGNPLGVNTSNYRTILLGCTGTPPTQAWFAGHTRSSASPVALTASFGALAVRLD